MTLSIDTTVWERAIIKLLDADGHTVDEVTLVAQKELSARLLSGVDDMLKRNGVQQSQLLNIHVQVGPGSFTGTRIGVSMANALGLALRIPVNKSFDPAVPVYNAEPSIGART